MTDHPLPPIPSLADLGVPPAVCDAVGEEVGGLVLFAGPDMAANREIMLAAVVEHRDRHEATCRLPHRQRGIMSQVGHTLPETCEILDTDGMSSGELHRRADQFVRAYWDPNVTFTDMDLDRSRAGMIRNFPNLVLACIPAQNLDEAVMGFWNLWFAHMQATTSPGDGYETEERWGKERFWSWLRAAVFRLDVPGTGGAACLTHSLIVDDATADRMAGLHTSRWPSAILSQASWSEPKAL